MCADHHEVSTLKNEAQLYESIINNKMKILFNSHFFFIFFPFARQAISFTKKKKILIDEEEIPKVWKNEKTTFLHLPSALYTHCSDVLVWSS